MILIFSSLVVKGYKKILVFEDLFDFDPDHMTKSVIPRFEKMMKVIFTKYKRQQYVYIYIMYIIHSILCVNEPSIITIFIM